jgi:hypothetical protein
MKDKREPFIDLAPDLFGGPARSKFLRRLVAQARNRARWAGIPFTLLPEQAEELFQKQDGRCDVTAIEFHMERFPEALVKHPFAPSIDRRLSQGGYTPDNVRLVCVGVNFGMGQWGQEVYLRLARAAVARENEETNQSAGDWYARQTDRIAAAEKILDLLPANECAAQMKHITGLKAALRLGPAGLSARAKKAAERQRNKRKPEHTQSPERVWNDSPSTSQLKPPSEYFNALLRATELPCTPVELPKAKRLVRVRTMLRREQQWAGPVPTSFSSVPNKPVLELDGQPIWAEFILLRLLEGDGWNGAWVKNWGGRAFWRNPVEVTELSPSASALLHRIEANRSYHHGGCWDIFAWRGDEFIFIESKQRGRDRLRPTQRAWIEASLDEGVPLSSFVIVEWLVQ